MPHDVFLMCAKADEHTGKRLCEALEGAGLDCWWPCRDIPSGTVFAKTVEAVEEALRSKPSDRPLGEILVEKAAVTPEVVERSLAKQARQKAAQSEQTIRVDVSRLDALMNLVGELVLGKNRLARLRNQLEERWEGEELTEQLAETSSQIASWRRLRSS